MFSPKLNPIRLPLVAVMFICAALSLAAAVSAQETAATAPVEPKSTPNWTMPDQFLALQAEGAWPKPTAGNRPGAIWWWPASAVTPEDLTWNLDTYSQAGWGNMGIVGIYGVRGEEESTIDLFSPEWFKMYNHTNQEARRLGMNLDLTPSGGWRWGGPHVTPEFAEQKFSVKDGKLVIQNRKDKVKRAGPGGIGMTANPYSQAAVQFHLDWFDQRMKENAALAPRSFYYDSFENNGNWCDEFPEYFRAERGYSLEDHAAALDGETDTPDSRRVLADYRATLSSILIDRVHQIAEWGKRHGSSLRMQAHGAPANLLDMYAAGGIPETEVFGASKFDIPGFRRDPKWIRADQQSDLVNRFASSAAHVAGRPLITSESFTWLRNHYHTTLSQIKAEADGLLLNGINGIYYHGACFAPEETQWPGWLFYASTQANPRNSIFRDVPVLNAYITRCQSVLQSGRPHNDILLYWPVQDLWNSGGSGEQRYTVHHPEWIEESQCGEVGRHLLKHGYAFDFVSDAQLSKTSFADGGLKTEGGSQYQTVLIPAADFMPLETANQIIELAKSGATVLVWKTLPANVPGWFEHESRAAKLSELWKGLSFDDSGIATLGKGKVVVQSDLEKLLGLSQVKRETMTDLGLQFIRRTSGDETQYFIVNHTAKPIDQWLSLGMPCRSAMTMDPMSGRAGVTALQGEGVSRQVYLQMQPGETRILRVSASKDFEGELWPLVAAAGDPIAITGKWQLKFTEGGPELPADATMENLASWAELDAEKAKAFAGSAQYTIEVNVPQGDADGWVLELGDVRESARVWVNDKPAGAVVAHPFQVDLGSRLKPGVNKLTVEVTNLSANRIRDLDRRGVDWKKFHDINFVTHLYKPFDASEWELEPSGLMGPVSLLPYKKRAKKRASEEKDVSTLYLIGDSTVKTGKGKGGHGQWGWGSVLDKHFDGSKIKVVNRALGGRSSRTFLTEGLWAKVLKELQPGDFVLMQFGHNDGGEMFTSNRPRASIQGNGDETEEGVVEQTGKSEVVHSYGWYLRNYISEAQQKGATAIVLSPVPRKKWEGKRIVRSDYAQWAKEAAATEEAAFVDLHDIVAQRYEGLGVEAVETFFADEHTHTSLDGANVNAECVVAGLLALPESLLTEGLSGSAKAMTPAKPAQVAAPDDRPVLDDDDAALATEKAVSKSLPTLYIMGDSTVRNGQRDGVGWGEVIGKYFDANRINVANKAIGGRSTRTYLREKRWQGIFEKLNEGDFVVMQFGHNDGGRVGDPRYKRRPALPGVGDETQEVTFDDGTVEVVHTYGWYLKQFCEGVISKRATPIICSPVPHKNNWKDGTFTPDFVDHRKWCQQVAENTGAHFVDLTALIGAHYQSLGESSVENLFADVRTHTNLEGAEINAENVVAGLKAISGQPLRRFLSSIGSIVLSARRINMPGDSAAIKAVSYSIRPLKSQQQSDEKTSTGNWYVAPDGDDSASGTIDAPFASIQRAQRSVSPGDTVFIRGGTYRMSAADIPPRRRFISSVHILYRSGSPGKPITYRAYKNERPVFDCSKVKPENRRVDAFYVSGSWLRLIGLEVTGVQVTQKGHTQSICFHNEGSHNIYERLSMHDGQAIGIYSVGGSNNLFLNCDAWNNWDYTSEDGKGGNVDGFGCHPPRGGSGNVFRGCRAWNNSDDGFDFINASESVTVENCWAFRNGFSVDGKRLADGNGFKIGGFASTPLERIPDPVPRHTVENCIAFGNKNSGFYANHHPGGSDWIGNKAGGNDIDYNMLGRRSGSFDDVAGWGHRMEQNVSFESRNPLKNIDEKRCKLTSNVFELDLNTGSRASEILTVEDLKKKRDQTGCLPAIHFKTVEAK